MYVPNSEATESARAHVRGWLEAAAGRKFESDTDLIREGRERLASTFGLSLALVKNPSACAWEGRWEHAGQPAERLEKPFSGETSEEAALLALAGAIRLIVSL